MHVDVFMQELSYEEIEQQEAYSMTDLWSKQRTDRPPFFLFTWDQFGLRVLSLPASVCVAVRACVCVYLS